MPLAWAQQPPPDHRPGPPPPIHSGPPGTWWRDPALAQRIGLTGDQVKRIDDIFQQNRIKLIDISAAVDREEAVLEPLLGMDHPEESRVLPQIDRIAQARAELEKARARMLLGFRTVLTPEQWKSLHADRPPPRDFRH